MNNGKNTSMLIVVLGAIILGVFIAVVAVNIGEKEEYFLSTDIIKSMDYSDGKLVVKTQNDIVSVCVKETKTTPSSDALCWVDVINDEAAISIYEYKTYHIWAKDNSGLITYYSNYNLQN